MEQIPTNIPAPVMESKPGPAGWVAVWMKVLTKPGEQTFVEITENVNATLRTAFIWIFIAGTISGLTQALIRGVYGLTGMGPRFPMLQQYMHAYGGDTRSTAMSLVIGLCLSPLVGLLAMLIFAIGVAITQWIAKLFGGSGTFEKLAYARAAISVPFIVIGSVLSVLGLIPFVGYCTGIISILLFFYILYLQITAVKAVNRFGWGPAIGAVLIPAFVILLACGCLVGGSMMLLGPAIRDAFNGINQSLAP